MHDQRVGGRRHRFARKRRRIEVATDRPHRRDTRFQFLAEVVLLGEFHEEILQPEAMEKVCGRRVQEQLADAIQPGFACEQFQ